MRNLPRRPGGRTWFPGPFDMSSQERTALARAEYELTVRPRRSGPLLQIAAEALNAAAGFFQVFGLGGVGNTKRRAETEGRPLHHRDAFGIQQLGDEVLVAAELLAGRGGLADGAGAGRIDVEGAFRHRAL